MSVNITVDTSQTDAFFSNITGKIKSAISGSLADTANNIQNTTTGLAPVDTGFMQSEIKVSSTDDSIDAEAGADYSSYVDDGTSRMSAQPFFKEPVNNIAASLPDKINNSIQASLGI